jgi:hypothetical protein
VPRLNTSRNSVAVKRKRMLRLAEVGTQYGSAPTSLVKGFKYEIPCAYKCTFTAA